MEITLFLLYTAIFSGILMYSPFFEISGIRKKYLVGIFLLKLICGIGLAHIYTDHYENRRTGDTFRFFDDARLLHESLDHGLEPYARLMTGLGMKSDPVAKEYYARMTHFERQYYTGFINDNATIIRLNAFVMLFSGGHYFVHIVFWCFFSMIGLVALLKVLVQFFPTKKVQMFCAVFLLPTVLFWGSGVLKEPILILGLGLFTYGFFNFLIGAQAWRLRISLWLGFLLLLLTKGYVLQCMAPAIVGLLLVKYLPRKNFWLMFSIPHIALILLIYIGPNIADGLKIAELVSLKQEAFFNIANESNAGSVIAVPEVNSALDLILNAPEALKNVYLRPWPWELHKLIYIPAAMENLLLLICSGIMLWNFKKPSGLSLAPIAFALSFVLVLGILTGQTVPILGAIVRYKLPALIFLFVLIFALTDDQKLKRRFPFLRKILIDL